MGGGFSAALILHWPAELPASWDVDVIIHLGEDFSFVVLLNKRGRNVSSQAALA